MPGPAVTTQRPFPVGANGKFERALDELLGSIAPVAFLQAWRRALISLCNNSVFDEEELAAACSIARVDTETILCLQQATLDAMQHVMWRGWRSRIGRHMPALPVALLKQLRTVTAVALAAVNATAVEAMPDEPLAGPPLPPSEEAGAKVADITRQAAWLTKAAERTAGAAGTVSSRCGLVLEASVMAFMGINAAAEASTQLAGSIEEISRELARTATSSLEASASADEAATMILQLEQAASQIGTVTDIIRRIATQTNLLALNATIEAARSGEAGRGFAIVANEVKALAKQTADATGNIGRMIGEIRSAVKAVAERVHRIQHTTTEVRHMTTVGEAAVEQQRASTNEISRSAQDAAAAVGQMQEGIEEIATQSFELSTASEALLAGTEVLNVKVRMSEGVQ